MTDLIPWAIALLCLAGAIAELALAERVRRKLWWARLSLKLERETSGWLLHEVNRLRSKQPKRGKDGRFIK